MASEEDEEEEEEDMSIVRVLARTDTWRSRLYRKEFGRNLVAAARNPLRLPQPTSLLCVR